MDYFVKLAPGLTALSHSLRLQFPPLLDRRDMYSMVEDFITVHKLRRSRGLDIEVLSLLRKAARPEHAILHKGNFGVSLHQELLRTRFPNLRHIEMVYSEECRQELVANSGLRLGGQPFNFNESFYEDELHPLILDSEWMKNVCLSAPKQVTSFKFEGLRLGADFAQNLALIPQTKYLDLSFIDTEGYDQDISPLLCPCCVREWQGQLTALPELVDLKIAFRSNLNSVQDVILSETYFPYLEDVLPPLSKLRKLSVDNWPLRLANFCQMVEALQSDQTVHFSRVGIDIKGTGWPIDNIPIAMLLPVVMAQKQVIVDSALIYCINHDHGRGPQRAIVGYFLEDDDIAEALADAEVLASQKRETKREEHMTEFRMEMMTNVTEVVDNTYDRLKTWLHS